MFVALAMVFAVLPLKSAKAEQTDTDTNDYLCFKAEADDVKIGMKKNIDSENVPSVSLEYSKDKEEWFDYEFSGIEGTEIKLEKSGDKVYFRAKKPNGAFGISDENYYRYYNYFYSDGDFSASGNIMYLLSNNLSVTAVPECGFMLLFYNCSGLLSAPVLPATTLAPHCYEYMFYMCYKLTEAPALPATNLADYCYCGMFDECRKLTEAPALPATNLADHCYYNMFSGCSELTEAPALPATNLAGYCYYGMFYGCSELIMTPGLPAETLAEDCYAYMFARCSNLTSAPALPATNLADHCYCGMFSGCSELITVPALPATELKSGCYFYMFSNCTSLLITTENQVNWEAWTIPENKGCTSDMFKDMTQVESTSPSGVTFYVPFAVRCIVQNNTPYEKKEINNGYITIDIGGYTSKSDGNVYAMIKITLFPNEGCELPTSVTLMAKAGSAEVKVIGNSASTRLDFTQQPLSVTAQFINNNTKQEKESEAKEKDPEAPETPRNTELPVATIVKKTENSGDKADTTAKDTVEKDDKDTSGENTAVKDNADTSGDDTVEKDDKDNSGDDTVVKDDADTAGNDTGEKTTGIGKSDDIDRTGSVVIPEKLTVDGEERTVTEISEDAFKKEKKLEAVEVPDTITDIGKRAFKYCLNLVKLDLGRNVSSIDRSAFYGCRSLENVELDDSLEYVGGFAFKKCTSLKNIDFGNSVKKFGRSVFSGCTSLESAVIPESVEEMGKNMFYGCRNLRTLTIETTKLDSNSLAMDVFNKVPEDLIIYVPSSKLKAYKKLFRAKGLSDKVKIDAIEE